MVNWSETAHRNSPVAQSSARRVFQYFFIAALMAASPATAQQATPGSMSVKWLLDACEAPESPMTMVCLAKISGVVEVMGLNGHFFKLGDVGDAARYASICAPSSVTYQTYVDVFKNWARLHPEHWADRDSIGVASAIQMVWPCLKR